jgi:hypothetical protein
VAPPVPTTEPKVFSAGDTISWTKALNDYPADDGWILSYAFRGEKGDGKLDVIATNESGTHTALISATDSALMRPGIWVWNSYATLGADRHTVGNGTTQVTPNLAATNFATDLRTSVKKAYDNAREAMETFAKAKMVILNGRTYTARDYADLKKYVDDCTTAWIQEEQAINGSASDDRHIYVSLDRYR